MTIKTTEKITTTLVKTFVSADGREWENEADCIEWEKGIKCVATTSWNAIPKTMINAPDFGIAYANEDDEAYIIVPRSHEDIVSIVNFVRITTRDELNLTDFDIGQTLILDFGYDRDYCSFYRTEDHLRELRERISNTVADLVNGKNVYKG